MESGNRLEIVLRKPKYVKCGKCGRTRNQDERKDCPFCIYGKPKHQPHYRKSKEKD